MGNLPPLPLRLSSGHCSGLRKLFKYPGWISQTSLVLKEHGYSVQSSCIFYKVSLQQLYKAGSTQHAVDLRLPGHRTPSSQSRSVDSTFAPCLYSKTTQALLVCSQPSTGRDEKLDFIHRRIVQFPIWRKCDWSG